MHGRKKTKTNTDIANEWDNFAILRLQQLERNEDISMDFVLTPLLFEMALNADFSNVIDLGCGTGYVTKQLAKKSNKILGIDVSSNSIKVANENKGKLQNLHFIHSSIEEFALNHEHEFTIGFSNMTLMDVPNLDDVIQAASKLINENGYFIITITHPYFWPFYWKYYDKDWFNYSEEIEIESEFKISSTETQYTTTHYHRPLEKYINTLTNYGFQVEKIFEPIPDIVILRKYPHKWNFPRFLGIRCKKKML